MEKILSYRELNEHYKEGCPTIKNFICPLKCNNELKFFKEELFCHLEHECPNMEVNCQGCGESQKRENFKKHDMELCILNLKSKRVKQEAEISILKSELKSLADESS